MASAEELALPFDRLLLVTSQTESRTVYARSLRSGAATIDGASDGCEALIKTVIHRPSLMDTDAGLARFSGYELIETMRGHRDTADIPIVVVTTIAPDELARAQRAGADSVLVKRCAPQTLLSEVRRLMLRARELRRTSNEIRLRAATQLAKSDDLLRIRRQRRTLSRTFARFGTTDPPIKPPALSCPGCLKPPHYQRSHLGGVSEKQPEQWDYYECTSGCGTFQFRHRTRKLRKTG